MTENNPGGTVDRPAGGDRLRWDELPEDVRQRVDALVIAGRRIHAIETLRDCGLEPRPTLRTRMELVADRFVALADRIVRPPAPTVDSLLAAVSSLPTPAQAIEALWDGDTQGWCVYLAAVSRNPRAETALAVLRHGTDLRLFNGDVPPWPEAEEATRLGQAVAERLGIPFHFTSPDTPDVFLPRWWDA